MDMGLRIASGYQSRLVAYVYYAPDDPHVTNPNQPGYVGSNQPGGGYSGSGSPSSGGGGGGGVGSSALADMESALASGALQKVGAGQSAYQSITPAGSNKTTTYNSAGQIIANPTGYDFTGPTTFGLMMPTTWQTLDPGTQATFNSYANSVGYPGGGQALWQYENTRAQNGGSAVPTGGQAATGPQTWDTLDPTIKATFNGYASSINYPGGGQALWQYQNSNPVSTAAPNAAASGPNWFTLDPATRATFNGYASQINYPGGGQALWQYQQDHPATAANVAPTATVAGALPMDDPQRAKLQQAGFTGNAQVSGAYDPNLTQAEYNAISQGAQQAGQQQQQEDAYAAAQQANIQSQANAQKLSEANQLLGTLGTAMGSGSLPVINAALQAAGLPQLSAASQQAYQQQQTASDNRTLATSLLSSLNGPYGPGEVPVINAALQALGLPPISTGEAGSLMPNGITPAMWDAMPAAAQQLILQAWQARGGNPTDFTNAINAQRPQGNLGEVSSVRYAPLAA